MKVIIYKPHMSPQEYQDDSRIYGDHMVIWDEEDINFSSYAGYDIDISYEIMARLLGYRDIIDFATSHGVDLEIWAEEDRENISEEEREKLTDLILEEFDESGMEFVVI